jgi:ribosomal protein S18 acetylase RimI-like enzyme
LDGASALRLTTQPRASGRRPAMTDITFRTALIADAAPVAEIYLASRKTYLSFAPLAHPDEGVRGWIRDQLIPGGDVTVAEKAGEVIGIMALSQGDGTGWIDQLYLATTEVGQGLGARFVERAKQDLGSPIRLYTFQQNKGARRFYERLGFEVLEYSDGSRNEEGCPDILYEWKPGPA